MKHFQLQEQSEKLNSEDESIQTQLNIGAFKLRVVSNFNTFCFILFYFIVEKCDIELISCAESIIIYWF